MTTVKKHVDKCSRLKYTLVSNRQPLEWGISNILTTVSESLHKSILEIKLYESLK